jgi:hypothetical protein
MIHTIGYGTVNGMMTVRAVARAAERDAVNDLIDQIAGTMLTVSRKILFGLVIKLREVQRYDDGGRIAPG